VRYRCRTWQITQRLLLWLMHPITYKQWSKEQTSNTAIHNNFANRKQHVHTILKPQITQTSKTICYTQDISKLQDHTNANWNEHDQYNTDTEVRWGLSLCMNVYVLQQDNFLHNSLISKQPDARRSVFFQPLYTVRSTVTIHIVSY